jgi:hypothetical protein
MLGAGQEFRPQNQRCKGKSLNLESLLMPAYLEYPFTQANLLLKALTVSRKLFIPLIFLNTGSGNIDGEGAI